MSIIYYILIFKFLFLFQLIIILLIFYHSLSFFNFLLLIVFVKITFFKYISKPIMVLVKKNFQKELSKRKLSKSKRQILLLKRINFHKNLLYPSYTFLITIYPMYFYPLYYLYPKYNLYNLYHYMHFKIDY